MGDSMQLFQQKFEAFMKQYNEDQQRIQSQFEEISGGTGNTNHRWKLDFPCYDGSTDPLPWMSRYDYYFRHQRFADEEKRIAHIWTGRSLRTIIADDLVLMVVVFEKLVARTYHPRPEQEVEILISGLQDYIAVEVKLQRPTYVTSAMYFARLYERREINNELIQQVQRVDLDQTNASSSIQRPSHYVKRLSRAEIAERRA
ncbi:hypothetical protein Tco_1445222 [Tanacetum coccineum]